MQPETGAAYGKRSVMEILNPDHAGAYLSPPRSKAKSEVKIMGNNAKYGQHRLYRKCPKCGLNYITGTETMCKVCAAAMKPYRGKYCKTCGEKSGLYNLCRNCFKQKDLTVHERRAAMEYRGDSGMVGSSTRRVCRICGVPTYGQLCGKCYMATRDREENNDEDDD